MMLNSQADPAISVVLVSSDEYASIAKVVNHLRRQTVRDRIELVLVIPSREQVQPPADLDGEFATVRLVEVGPIASKDRAAAEGVRRADAAIVALIEDHAYPSANWAEALIQAHEQPWAGVGTAIGNANPTSVFSWANLLMSYGQWFEPDRSRAVGHLPAHNSSYKREVLLEFADDLDHLLEREGLFHQALTSAGYRLYLEASALTYHVNVSRASSSVSLRLNAARLFAASRAREGGWSRWRRLGYVAALPLIPILRLRHLWPDLARAQRSHRLGPRILPALSLLLLAHGAGEALGYARGSGDSHRRMAGFEFRRTRFLNQADQAAEIDSQRSFA